MAGPIALASALARVRTIKCPWCGHKKAVTTASKPVAFRVCPKCKRHFPDPLAKKK
jgi:transcription elongation factor Elf1